MFSKRLPKLTEKAAQAISESNNKLKRKVSSKDKEPSKLKKSKTDSDGVNVTKNASISSSEVSPTTSNLPNHRASVQIEEEAATAKADAEVIEVSSDEEASDAELGMWLTRSLLSI